MPSQSAVWFRSRLPGGLKLTGARAEREWKSAFPSFRQILHTDVKADDWKFIVLPVTQSAAGETCRGEVAHKIWGLRCWRKLPDGSWVTFHLLSLSVYLMGCEAIITTSPRNSPPPSILSCHKEFELTIVFLPPWCSKSTKPNPLSARHAIKLINSMIISIIILFSWNGKHRFLIK